MTSRISLIAATFLAVLLSSCSSEVELPTDYFESPIPTEEQTQSAWMLRDFRDYRYCELLFTFPNGSENVTEVYATMGFNECPDEEWVAINAEALKEQYGALDIKKNGPRYWVLNKINNGDSEVGYDKIHTFGDIQMKLAAQISDELASAESYTDHFIKRWTIFKYKKNNRIYKLINPNGEVYVMQAYTTMVDATLTIDKLEDLGEILDLPDGWTFETEILEEDLELVSGGEATVVQDELENTYQKM